MQVITTEAKPIKSWCPDIEEGALDQAKNLANLPFVFKHVALMPDTHLGYGMPIGGVIATQGVVVPNAVGVDIGCTDKDTEYLTGSGWRRISEYNNEKIMQYDSELNMCDFATPLQYIVKPCAEFYYLKNGRVDQMLNDEHNVLLFSCRTGKPVEGNLIKWINKNKLLKKRVNQLFKTIIPISTNGIEISEKKLRLILAISADGCIRKGGDVEFHLKKKRKISRLQYLLKENSISPKIYNRKNGNFNCVFPFVAATKNLSFLWKANTKQMQIVIDEIPYWDGHIADDKQIMFYSTVKENIDVIQYAFAVTGIRSNFQKITHRNNPKWKSTYMLYATNDTMVGFPYPEKIVKVSSKDSKAYCFTTETGYWVMRRNGKIVITGNCGVYAVRTSLTELDQTTLKKIMGGLLNSRVVLDQKYLLDLRIIQKGKMKI